MTENHNQEERGIPVPARFQKVEKVLRLVIIVLTSLAVCLGAVCLVLALRYKWVEVEAGQIITAAELAGDENAVFGADYDPDMLDHAGIYFITVVTEKGEMAVRLKVVDTKAPEVKVKDIRCAVGGDYPSPEDFIDEIYEPDDYTGEYVTPLPEIKKMGTYPAEIRFTDASGNRTDVFAVQVTIVVDNEPPKVSAPEELVTTVGHSVDYSAAVTLTDDCAGKLTFTVDEGELLLDEVGEYTVYLVATDAVGNRSERIAILVRVQEEQAEGEGA